LEVFLEKPVGGEVVEIILSQTEKLIKEIQVGHYEIISEIGAGRIGEIFLARAERLN
jgi:hypothetical protein